MAKEGDQEVLGTPEGVVVGVVATLRGTLGSSPALCFLEGKQPVEAPLDDEVDAETTVEEEEIWLPAVALGAGRSAVQVSNLIPRSMVRLMSAKSSAQAVKALRYWVRGILLVRLAAMADCFVESGPEAKQTPP